MYLSFGISIDFSSDSDAVFGLLRGAVLEILFLYDRATASAILLTVKSPALFDVS